MHSRAETTVVLGLLVGLGVFTVGCAQNNSPQDKPVGIPSNAEQVKKFDDAIAPYVKKARETLPDAKKKYLAGLPPNQTFYVTIELYDTSKKEQVFIKVTSWKGGTIQGLLSSDISLIHNHSTGEKLTCNEYDILD